MITPVGVGVATISVRATDERGGFVETSFEVTVFDPTAPPDIVSNSPVSIAEASDLVIEASITGIIRAATLFYRQGGQINFTVTSMSASGGGFQAIIPGNDVTSRGVEYYIAATNELGVSGRNPLSGVSSVQVEVSDVVKLQAQPGGTAQTGYRLFSVPIDLTDKSATAVLEDDLGEYDITQWRFYSVAANQIKVQFSNTSLMSPGQGFWLIVREQGKRISTGAGTSNLTDNDFSITLHSQWNLIGNPFNFDIPVSNLSLSNSQSVELRTYTGSWNDPVNNPVTTIRPFGGYAIFNSSSTNTTLSINPDLSGGSNTLVKRSSFQGDWSLQIIAQSQAAVDGDNFLGLSSAASISWDEFDRPEPPVIGEFVSLYFPHPEWGGLSKNYCTDFRPEISDGEIWEFEVKTNIRDVVNLSFEGLNNVPSDYEACLIDATLKTSQNLRQKSKYSVAASVENPKRLQLLIGRPDFVDANLSVTQNIPQSFELSQNFPNPFNPTTTIRYGLPRAERVTLRIYNILGEEVVTLVNEELKPVGFHVAIWDGRNRNGDSVGSGIFIYQLLAGDLSMTKNMILVK